MGDAGEGEQETQIQPVTTTAKDENDTGQTPVLHDDGSNDADKSLNLFEAFRKEHDLADDLNTAVVYQTYQDLQLVRKWKHLKVMKRRNTIYLTGTAPPAFDSVFPHRQNTTMEKNNKNSRDIEQDNSNSAEQDTNKDEKTSHDDNGDSDDDDATQAVVSIASSAVLTPETLRNICNDCGVHPRTGAKLRCVTLAIVDDDSTTAYYRIFDQFSEITHPQWKRKKRRRVEPLTSTAKPADRVATEFTPNFDEDDGNEDCVEDDSESMESDSD